MNTAGLVINGTLQIPAGASNGYVLKTDGSGNASWGSTASLSGPQGNQGNQGVGGSGGTQGTQGFQGRQGFQGATGVGTQGNQGVAGTNGTQGNQGVTGSSGTGTQGNQGVAGANGTQGNQGVAGANGTQGNQGVAGANGTQGNQGVAGSNGTQGNQGVAGSNGTQGNQGVTGSGTQGNQGVQGSTGTQGVAGSGSAAGSNTQVQFNNSGAFGGATNLVWDNTNSRLAVGASSTSTATLDVQGGVRFKRTAVSSTPYSVLTTDYLIAVTGPASARTINLPAANTFPAGQILVVSDESGNAATNTITINRNGTDTIEGATSKVINVNYGAIRFYSNGTSKWFTTVEIGNQGFQGVIGTQGNQGVAGSNGTQGNQGVAGSNGNQGNQGVAGSNGTQGNQGVAGSNGTQGNQGNQGVTGAGTQGVQGATGPQGGSGQLSIGATTISGGTTGSVLFVGTSTFLQQDNANFFWDDTNNRLGIGGTTSPQTTLDVRGGVSFKRTAVSSTPYTVLGTDNIIGVTGPASARTINLPTAASTTAGQMYIISDESGTAATNNITINRAGTDTIEGNTSFVINTNYGAVRLYSDGAGKWYTTLQPGTQGFQGRQGFQGVAGSNGTQGNQGVAGSNGTQGNQGVTGSGTQGNQGVAGSNGTQGNQGVAGTGTQGNQGVAGSNGTQGNQGVAGSNGTQGNQGVAGTGTQGNQGVAGTNGTQGNQGVTGAGTQGNQGFQGVIGNQGVAGSGSAAGSTTQVQYNNGGAFGGATNLIWDNSNSRLVVGSSSTSTSTLDVQGSIRFKRTVVSTTPYTILGTDNIIACTGPASARSYTLPSAASTPAGQMYIISDESGTAATNNITINRAGTDTIEGATTRVLSTNYGAVRLYSNGSNAWFTTLEAALPAGSNTQVQFNNSGAFGGATNLVWDNTNSRLSIGNTTNTNASLTAGGTASIGDKIRLYGNNETSASRYGLAVQSNTLVAYTDGTAGTFSFRRATTTADPSSGTEIVGIGSTGQTTISTQSTSTIGAQIRQFSSGQTANLLELTSSGGTTKLSFFGPQGYLRVNGTAAPACALDVTGGIKFGRTVVSSTPYTLLASDYLVGVTGPASARTINLPAANAVGVGQSFVISDESGTAATNNITINRAGTDTIEGATSYVINTNYGSVKLYSDGTSKWFTTSQAAAGGTDLSGAVILAPGSNTRNLVTPTGDFKSLVLKAGSASQTQNMMEILNNSNTIMDVFGPQGYLGVGTGATAPISPLDIRGTVNGDVTMSIRPTSSATADVIQIYNTAASVASNFDKDGYGFPISYRFALAVGTAAMTGTNKTNVMVVERACKIVKCFIVAKTGPSGAALICDIKKGGTSIWSTNTGNRIQIASGSTTGTQTSFDTTTLAEGDQLTIDIAQVGSTTAGQDITVQLLTLARNQ